MASHGFSVVQHYLGLDTAWRAEFSHKTGGRVIGVNAEMDALPGIGHACGHNLIAIAGLAVAVGIKIAITQHDIPGTVVLLGTPGNKPSDTSRSSLTPVIPAEENGGGKVTLLERGAYTGMDACLMYALLNISLNKAP